MERNFLQLMWRGWCRSRELQPVCWGRNTVKTYRTSLNRWLKPREINTYPIKFKGAAIKYWFLVLSWRCNKRTNTSIRMLFVFFVLSLFFDQTRTEIGHIEVKSSPEGGGAVPLVYEDTLGSFSVIVHVCLLGWAYLHTSGGFIRKSSTALLSFCRDVKITAVFLNISRILWPNPEISHPRRNQLSCEWVNLGKFLMVSSPVCELLLVVSMLLRHLWSRT